MTRERGLDTERDHWRTLLDVTNTVVTKRDLGELRAAIAPNVRRIVPHDHTNLFLIDGQARLQSFVIDPTAVAWRRTCRSRFVSMRNRTNRGCRVPRILTSRTRIPPAGKRCAHMSWLPV